jgi:hypothetical protein
LFLEPALQIHSVEAKQGSEANRLRANFHEEPLIFNTLGCKTLDNRDSEIPAATQIVYAGE